MIRKGKLQKYVKKGESRRFRDGNKKQRESSPKDEDNMSQPPQNVIGEIKTISGGPFTGGSFRSLRKVCQRQVSKLEILNSTPASFTLPTILKFDTCGKERVRNMQLNN